MCRLYHDVRRLPNHCGQCICLRVQYLLLLQPLLLLEALLDETLILGLLMRHVLLMQLKLLLLIILILKGGRLIRSIILDGGVTRHAGSFCIGHQLLLPPPPARVPH